MGPSDVIRWGSRKFLLDGQFSRVMGLLLQVFKGYEYLGEGSNAFGNDCNPKMYS